ncbi:dihydrodipicolinate synthase family protein [Endobacterium cereale]|uniref:dihydrodipicolinate synthase family protein n=1 Tax=Endobacterium cereale TaxID=2663029 RepID=UPI001AD95051|nr:dihydrodipicolinate synthase family protein [Endobacterium cereale]MEB2847405.1 dihydrodipicolinate synthase family protein [Endobacterium cereale]
MTARLSNIRTVTALITPFAGDDLNRSALATLVDCQVRAGIDAVIVCDVTGEGYALSDYERDTVLSTCLERAEGRLAVLAATSTYGTGRSIALSERAQQLGADGLLVTVPYYSKPTKAGVASHFRNIAEATHLPIIIDDDPQRTVIEGGAALLSALSDVHNVVGVRHGAGRLAAFARLDPVLRRRYHHYCADEVDLPAFLACGAHGMMSSYGNLFPFRLAAVGRGFAGAAGQFRREMAALLEATGGQWDAAVIKAACAILHGDSENVRLPMVGLDDEMREAVRRVLVSLEAAAGELASQTVA